MNILTIRLFVLPLEDLSNDPEKEYFSDGLTEETISYLGRINTERIEPDAVVDWSYSEVRGGVDNQLAAAVGMVSTLQ